MTNRRFKVGDFVQDSKDNVYEVIRVGTFFSELAYALKSVRRAEAYSTLTDREGYHSFDVVGEINWISNAEPNDQFLTEGELKPFDPQKAEIFKQVRYFKDEIYQDKDGNQFTVLEDCTFGDASCKVRLTKRVSDRIITGGCLYEDSFIFAHIAVSRTVYDVIIHEDEVFMDELTPIHLNNNARTIQFTKPEDQKETKSKLLTLIRQMQNINDQETLEPEISFKERMKQKATKVKVAEVLEIVERAASNGEFTVIVPGSDNVKDELKAYGLSVYDNVVNWIKDQE